jgi:hypothetical protein
MKIYNCLICKHQRENEDGDFICPAFPEGIPQEKLEEADVESRQKPCKGQIKFESNL